MNERCEKCRKLNVFSGYCLPCTDEESARQEREKIRKLIREYIDMYPRTLFKEPPPGQHGRTVDGCSARAIRTVLRALLKDIKSRD